LRKGSGHAIEIATKLEYNAYPAVWATPPEQSLSTWLNVRFSMEGMFDGQHDV